MTQVFWVFAFTQPLQNLMETRPSVGSEPAMTPSPERCIRSCPHRTVTLGSWVTPQVITALVPLITLWSWGGVVILVRAAKTEERGK